MTKPKVKIRKVTLAEAYKIHKQIPEFTSNPHPPSSLSDFMNEVKDTNFLCIAAYDGNEATGYCISYDKFKDGSLYLWMAGVVPKYRKTGIFKLLTKHQERWAGKHGYKSIVVRTWNKRVGMRIALAKLRYDIVGFIEKPKVEENRLVYKKSLKKRNIK